MALIACAQDGHVATLMMTYREKRNALGSQLIAEMLAALDAFRQDRVRVVVLRAEPKARIWSSGFDVSELTVSDGDPLARSDPMRPLVQAIRHFPGAVIGLIEGGVWGGALEVAIACDVLVATPEATFALTPARIGVAYPLAGLHTLLEAMPLAVLKEMAFTAEPIGAERAERLGIVNKLVAPEAIDDETMALARRMAALAPLSIVAIKEQLRLLTEARGLSPMACERAYELRRQAFTSTDLQEGLQALVEKRPPAFKGQ
jgi:methylmalonyl-CoA decarboxylase